MSAYCGCVKYGMYLTVPEVDEKVLFHVFSPALLAMSPSFRGVAAGDIQLDFIESLAGLVGATGSWNHGTKTKAEEFRSLIVECHALPILIEMEKTDEFTYYHLFGLDASSVKFIRSLAKDNFDLYRVYTVLQRGMFGLRGRLLRIDSSDRTFRTLLGDVLSREQMIGDQRNA